MEIKYPILYAENEEIFNNYGLAILNDAYEVVIVEELNGQYVLKFYVPLDEKLKSVINEAFWVKCDNRIFSINILKYEKTIQGTVNVFFECEHITFFLRNGYINFEEYAGRSTRYIVTDLLDKYLEKPFRFKPATWMNNTDNLKFEFRNKNIYEALQDIVQKIGGEIECYNMPDGFGKFEIGIRQPQYNDSYEYTGGGRGSFKLDIQIRDGKNIKSVRKEKDYTNVVTKLHVYGKTGGTFENTTIIVEKDGVTPLVPTIYIANDVDYFIDNSKYNTKVGYIQFPDIDNKQELYWAGKAKWDELRKPRLNYDIEIVDLRYLEEFMGHDDFQIGDVVTFLDSDLEEQEKVRVRVTTYECYPLEPENNKAVFSTTRNTIFYTFNEFLKTADTVKAVANTNKQVKVASLEKVYVETSEVVVDTVNDPYNGVFVINGYYDGTIFSGDTKEELSRSGLFFPKPDANVGSGLDGGFMLYNKEGVGIVCNNDDTTPKLDLVEVVLNHQC